MGRCGHPTIFSDNEENSLVTHLTTVADWGFPMNLFDLRCLAKIYLDQQGRKVTAFKDNLPGKDWAASFVKRHSEQLTRRICQNIKVARSKIDATLVNKYFDNLTETVESVPESNIINYDETNLSDDPGASKFIFKY